MTGSGLAYCSLVPSIGSWRGGLSLEDGRVSGENAVGRGIGGLSQAVKSHLTPRCGRLHTRGCQSRNLKGRGC